MKKVIIFLICLFTIVFPVYAEEVNICSDDTNKIFISEEKYGIKNSKDKVVVKATYDSIEKVTYKNYEKEFYCTKERYIVSANGSYGLINSKGTLLLPTIYKSITTSQVKGYYIVEVGSKFGIVIEDRSIIVPVEYDKVTILSDGIYAVESGNITKIINKKQKVLYTYDQVITSPTNVTSNKYFYLLNDKFGVIDETGKVTVNATFDAVSYLKDCEDKEIESNLAIVVTNSKYGVYDLKNNKYTIPMQYSRILYDSEGKVFYARNEGKYYSFDINGTSISKDADDDLVTAISCRVKFNLPEEIIVDEEKEDVFRYYWVVIIFLGIFLAVFGLMYTIISIINNKKKKR